jgi:hypothetical protein
MGNFLTLMFLLLCSWAQGTAPTPHRHARRGHHATVARRSVDVSSAENTPSENTPRHSPRIAPSKR